MKYLLDSNIFIRSKNEMPFELWPTFWACIKSLIQNGDVVVSVKIKDEIKRGDDDMAKWLKDVTNAYYPLDSEIIAKYAEVQKWAKSQPQFTPAALQEFAEVADAYLVATAAAKDMTVVTYETSQPQSKRRVKIPDACIAMNVAFCDLNSVLRNLGVTI